MKRFKIQRHTLLRIKDRAKTLPLLNNSIRKGKGVVVAYIGEEVVKRVLDGEIEDTYDYDLVYGDRVKVDVKTKERMKEVLKDIQSGKFAKQWMDENKNGQKNFLKMRKELAEHPIEKVGKKLRDLMPWIGKNKLVDKSKN